MSEWSALGYAITELGRDVLPESVSGKGGFPVKTPQEVVNMARNAEAAQILDRHGDNRFADNILRALEGLPQNGDDEEERDAAEEGALIEASNLPDPQFESNGRY